MHFCMAQPRNQPQAMLRAQHYGTAEPHSTAGFKTLLLGSIGVVCGDIGTSPLYAVREPVMAASGSHAGITRQAVFGVVSLILWALIILVTLRLRRGISVIGTMVVTAMMGFVVIRKIWRWSPFAAALIAPFLFLDLTFFAANLVKLFEDGWCRWHLVR
jgi:K+ transporter